MRIKRNMKFTRREINDLLISWAVLSFALAVLWWGIDRPLLILRMMPQSIIAVGTGFAFHEMAHKYVAQKYGLAAEFRRWDFGLLMAVISSFLGFLFAAPGAVHIFGYADEKTMVKTSVSGPATNFIIALISIGLSFFISSNFLHFLAYFNLFLALFNLLPVPPMDGSKVLRYSPLLWGVMFFSIIGLLLFVL
ncbi:MAG TPA: site-2 protease family protein [Euryarchaeota archaeon]|nr:site-2 protease family protein [Euryarchaeota archaeon]